MRAGAARRRTWFAVGRWLSGFGVLWAILHISSTPAADASLDWTVLTRTSSDLAIVLDPATNRGMSTVRTGVRFGRAGMAIQAAPTPSFSKSFVPSLISVVGTTRLTFMIDNTTSGTAASSLAFTDTLPMALVLATPANASTDCTGGTITAPDGGSTVSYTGGTVGAGARCSVSVDVTSSTAGMHVNVSGDLTFLPEGNSGSATDTLTVLAASTPLFSKSFAPSVIGAGGTSTLTFTIDNIASGATTSSLDFTDTLPAAVVLATPSNPATTCTGGTLTAPAGGSMVMYTGGTVGAGANCTVTVDVTSSTTGMHVNTSGDLTSSGGNSGSATDTLTVVAASTPLFSKSFASSISVGETTTLTFMIDNTTSGAATSSLDFTDTLPAAVVLATPSNPATTCTGGTLTAPAGGSMVMYTGGTVGAGANCTVTVDVTSSTTGMHVNTSGDLTSSGGNSGSATDTLTVVAASTPLFSKSFASSISVGETTTLTFMIDNTTSGAAASSLAFTDTLPMALVLATPANGATDCTGGTLTAPDGGSMVSYTGGAVGAGARCSVTVGVTSSTAGTHVNTSGDLTSSAGNSGSATDTLTVAPAVPALPPWALAVLLILLITGSSLMFRQRRSQVLGLRR